MPRRLPHSSQSALLLAVTLLFVVLWPTSLRAIEETDVAVLPIAGVESAPTFTLDSSPDGSTVVRNTGALPLISGPSAPGAFTDFKLLPGDDRLLSGFDGRGAVITDATGQLTFQLASQGDKPDVPGASVASYGPDGEPARLLIAENGAQKVAIYDRNLERNLWSKQLVIPAVPAELVQAIALPDQRVAYAANWPATQVTAVDVLPLNSAETDQSRVRFANRTHPNQPQNLVPVPELTEVRDLFGMKDGRLLVTTAQHLLILSVDNTGGTREATFDLEAADELGGEFGAARQLPSGHIVATTVEPGLWTRPHPNHRIVWLEPGLESITAVSSALDRAPWRVEVGGGHGGSGTLDFSPDLDFLPTGTVRDVDVAGRLEIRPRPVRVDSTGTVGLTLANASAHPVVVPSVTVQASPGSCEEFSDPEILAQWTDIVIETGQTKRLDSSFRFGPDRQPGAWCARTRGRARDGSEVDFDEGTRFRVTAPGADTGHDRPGVEPVDLELRAHAERPDTGIDPGPGGFDTDPPDSGCGCSGNEPSAPAPLSVLVVVGGYLVARSRPSKAAS